MNTSFNKLTKRILLSIVILTGLCFTSVSAKEKLTLNFTDADINAVISSVSEMTGQNFIVDPRVKGKVTIISKKAMNADDVYQVFLFILKVHGFAAIPGKHITKIVPEVNAKQDAVPTFTRRHSDLGDEFITQVIEVKHVNAAQLVPILRPLVPQRGHLAAYPSSNILVISDSAANINRLMKIINRIDQATSDELEIIKLKHASASEIVRVINQLTRQNAKTAGSGSKLKIVADDRTNSILLGGDKSRRIKLRSIIAHLDTEVDNGSGATHVVYLHYAKAADLVKVLTGVSKNLSKKGKTSKVAGSFGNNISIQADETTNALVINAPLDIYRTLKAVIQKLDIRRAQILIEGVIAEVSVNSVESFGVSWGAAKLDATGNISNDAPVGVVDFNGAVSGLLTNPPSIGSGLSLIVGKLSGSTKIGALITAFASDSGTNIISTPSILTMDNEESEIVVAKQVPFTTGSFSSTGTGGGATAGNPFQTIERSDVGLTLKIKPQVNEGDTIKLEVLLEQSALLGSAIGTQPITSKRSIKSSIMVEDGQMIVLGGLIEEKLVEKEEKVPLLGDIPLLGWFFKFQSTSNDKTNFMLFLSPKILKDAAMQSGFTSEKYNYIRAKQLDIRERGVRLLPDETSPLLPEFKKLLVLPTPFGQEEPTDNTEGSIEERSIDDSNIDSTETNNAPPGIDDVSNSGLSPSEKLLFQQELISRKNKQSILNGDVF